MTQLKDTLGLGLLSVTLGLAAVLPARAQDQTVPGAGNATAIALSNKSPMVQSAKEFLLKNIKRIDDASVRAITLDAIANPTTCVAHRAGLKESDKNAILQNLITAGLVDVRDNSNFPGGLKAGVFPPLLDDGESCPKLPQTFFSAPGSFFGGHHSYPGGLPVHESFSDVSNLNLAKGYRKVYGHTGPQGLPVIGSDDNNANESEEMATTFLLSHDVTIAAPIWHDWAKSMVFQWNSDGSEFQELSFGGNGQTDNFGATGNSKTGAHHMISAAEAMKRGLPADLVIAQVSAHSHTIPDNEFKVVNWLHTAAIMAQIDPVAMGYLARDAQGRLRLPPVRHLGEVNLNAALPSQTNLLAEYPLHALSDADSTLTEPAVTIDQVILRTLAPEFGFDPNQVAAYNNGFRNPVFSFLTAERILIIYGNSGLNGVRAELNNLRKGGII